MIELTLTGTVDIESEHSERGTDGRADYAVRSIIRQTTEIDATKEFQEGYVNLEGYVLSRHWATEDDMLARFAVYDNPGLDGWNVRDGTAELTVEMYGSTDDWIQQAARYVTERPDLSVAGALEKFQNWEETNSDNIQKALDKISDAEHVGTEVGGLSEVEYGKR